MMELLIVFIAMIVVAVACSIGFYHYGYERCLDATPEPKVIDNTERRPVCLCNHGSNFHKDGTGPCTETIRWEVLTDRWAVFDKRVKCRCLQYTGPTPLPLVYHPAELEK